MAINRPFDFEMDDNAIYDFTIIIGNGFDKSLGFQTGHQDYIQSIEFNNIVESGNLIAAHLRKKSDHINWIDIELELALYSISHEGQSNKDFYNNYTELLDNLTLYLSNLSMIEFPTSSNAYKLIEYISDYTTYIIDFNYTNSIKKIFDLRNRRNVHPGIKHVNIHGSTKENNIIFGVDDKANISSEHIYLKNSHNLNYTSIDFNKVLKDSSTIGIFGHSLGETDHMYFTKFFQDACKEGSAYSNKNITIYYYGVNGYHDICRQLDTLTKKSVSLFKRYNNVAFVDTKDGYIST